MRGVAAVAVVVAAVVLAAAGDSRVKLVENGYENVVIAISPAIPEVNAQELIVAIKKLIGESSEVLFKATRGRAFFRHVKVLLPISWTNTPYDQTATSENFQDSAIRVDCASTVYGDQPYTLQVGGCGEAGQYIHLTPDYLVHDSNAEPWGPRDKTLVHEWAKLRWGVFDEFGYPNDSKYPLFYLTTNIVEDVTETIANPNYCANTRLEGELRDWMTQGECRYLDNSLPDANCRFLPYADQSATSSLMSFYHITNIEEFCDKNSAGTRHNLIAPTRHNLNCEGRSVWDVITTHLDFSDGANPPTLQSTPPKVVVVRQEEAKFALVLDYSYSMRDYNRIKKLQRTAQRWLLHEVGQGSHVGIIKFGQTATVSAELTRITSPEIRQHLASYIDTKLRAHTCIGAGLEAAVEHVLQGQENAVILLITDGKENYHPLISTVMPSVVQSGARVVTIAFGEQADPQLESLAEATGGKTFTVTDLDTGAMLHDGFQGALTYQPADNLQNMRVKIHEWTYQGEEPSATQYFTVDASVGRDLEFRMETSSYGHTRTDPVLQRPDGTILHVGTFDHVISTWSIDVPEAEAGTWVWHVELSGDASGHILVDVTAKARDPDTLPIYTTAWASSGTAGVDATTSRVAVYAMVAQGNSPVVGANVKAYVTPPDGHMAGFELSLLDNGEGADTQAGDGIYSRFMTNYPTTGRYSIKAQVWDDGSAMVNNGFTVSRSARHARHTRAVMAHPAQFPVYCCGSVVPLDPSLATPTGNFTRVVSGGSFQVTRVPEKGDMLPPGRVTDLHADLSPTTTADLSPTTADLSPTTTASLALTWTATGDDLDAGTVSGYEIRISTNLSDLTANTFETASNDTFLLHLEESRGRPGLLLEAGELVEVEVALQGRLQLGMLYHVALRAVDDEGHWSPVSNLVSVMMPPVMPPFPVDEGWWMGSWILWLSIGLTAAVAVVLCLACAAGRRRTRQWAKVEGSPGIMVTHEFTEGEKTIRPL